MLFKTLCQEEFGPDIHLRNDPDNLFSANAWNDMDICLANVSVSHIKQKVYFSVCLFKDMLSSFWLDRSDVKLTDILVVQVLRHYFCGFLRTVKASEWTSSARFRKQVFVSSLCGELFAVIAIQFSQTLNINSV